MNRFLTKILVLLSIPFISLSVTGQGYVPLDLSDGATWSQTECSFKPDWGAVYKLAIFGDTVINHNSYKKIYFQSKRGAGICSTCNFTFNRDSASLFAFVRQDILTRKVYFVHPDVSDKEWLAYNFDITNVGQSITGFSLIFTTNPESTPVAIYVYQLTVDAIDSLCVNGEYVKRYFFGAGNGGNIYHLPEHWVEGVGSTHGLLVAGYGGPDWTHSLYCFHNQEEGVYFDSTAIQSCVLSSSLSCTEGIDCSPITSIEPGDTEALINIYPNPVREKLFIETKILSQKMIVTISNMMGHKILTKIIPASSELEYLSLHDLPSGLYYVTVESEGFFAGKKIIKE